ncbi:Bifunctional protein FolD 4, chloroplastic [Ancistrocladus abbreviatus]
MNERKNLNAVGIENDFDRLHHLNIADLALQGAQPLFVPCTPKGCIELLHRYGTEIKGRKAVVIGRSNVAGKPAALLLDREHATVTTVHSRTIDPEDTIRQADIIISTAGKANLVKGSWIKPSAVIIDVGINPVAESPRGYRLVGDVCYEKAIKVASAITPVPGGVGPMTIAMLLSNTLTSAKRAYNFHCDFSCNFPIWKGNNFHLLTIQLSQSIILGLHGSTLRIFFFSTASDVINR